MNSTEHKVRSAARDGDGGIRRLGGWLFFGRWLDALDLRRDDAERAGIRQNIRTESFCIQAGKLCAEKKDL